MKKLIIKLLGLDVLISEHEKMKQEMADMCEFTAGLPTQQSIIETVEKVAEMEDTPDLDDYVREDDINDRIESYLLDNDYVTKDYIDGEIEERVSDVVDEKIEEAIDDLDLESKVKQAIKEQVNEDGLRELIRKEVRSALLDSLRINIEVR